MTTPPPTLADLRREIDRIDEAMHRLLMERGEIIDTLIATKKTAESGSAFRPAREADMMKRLVERHRGLLPLDTVESIWRVIIATFTYVQAPFSVHADLSAGEAAMRDTARFHFGFTVPFAPTLAPPAWSRRSRRRAAIWGWCRRPAPRAPGGRRSKAATPRRSSRGCPSWSAPTIRPACRCSRIARPNPDALVTDVETWSVRVAGWGPAVSRALDPSAEVIAVPDRAFDGAALLVSVPRGGIDALVAVMVKAGASVRSKALVGSHATRYTVTAAGPARPAAEAPFSQEPLE